MSVSEEFNIFRHVVDFGDKVQFETGASLRTHILKMLAKPGGQMAFAQSMQMTRRKQPDFGVRLNDVENLFDGQILAGIPLDKADLSGTTMTPKSIHEANLFGTKADGLQIIADVVSDVRTDASTSLRGSTINANIIHNLVLAPGSDCRDIKIAVQKRDSSITGSIEGAMLEGARLPADLSGAKGAYQMARYTGFNDAPNIINAGDGVFISSSQYNGDVIVEAGQKYKDLADRIRFTSSEEDIRLMNAIVTELTHGEAKDWPLAQAARNAIREVQSTNPTLSLIIEKQPERLSRMPAESDIPLAATHAAHVTAFAVKR